VGRIADPVNHDSMMSVCPNLMSHFASAGGSWASTKKCIKLPEGRGGRFAWRRMAGRRRCRLPGTDGFVAWTIREEITPDSRRSASAQRPRPELGTNIA
jgi:hypothetical protein